MQGAVAMIAAREAASGDVVCGYGIECGVDGQLVIVGGLGGRPRVFSSRAAAHDAADLVAEVAKVPVRVLALTVITQREKAATS